MIGGFHETAVTDDHRDLVSQHLAAINGQLGANHGAYTVEKAFTQVVAGQYIHLHLTAGGQQVSALFFQPLGNAPATLEKVEQGHTEARNPN